MSNGSVHGMRHQGGFALIAILALLAVWGLSVFVGQLSATQFQTARAQNTAAALVEAREALLGDAISRLSLNSQDYWATGYLLLPDLGSPFEGAEPSVGDEGSTPLLNHTGNGQDRSLIGKFPWRTLGSTPLRDEGGECLWYVVSGRFKVSPKTDVMNWDTQGQIDIIDGSGKLIATNVAAMLVAPGIALDGQQREPANEAQRKAYSECGGNYDARNYLDSIQIDNAVAGEVNYFVGSINSRFAPNASNKRFVMANSAAYNDRFLYITVDDIFDRLVRRSDWHSDFASAIGKLLDDPDLRKRAETVHPEKVEVSSGAGKEKGTANLVLGKDSPCDYINDLNNRKFCRNWNEMFFLTTLPTPSRITIDGALSPDVCSRVLIFGGRRTASQSRASAAERANKDNYLEATNASSFSVPTATANTFSGKSEFDWQNPSADIIRCLP